MREVSFSGCYNENAHGHVASGEGAFGRADRVNQGRHISYTGGQYDSYLLIPEIYQKDNCEKIDT